MPRAVQDLLDAHFEDHVGMGADPWSRRRHFAQQPVELLARATIIQRINPDQHAVGLHELRAHLIDHVLGIDCRLGSNAKCLKFCKDAMVPIVVSCRCSARRSITAPENGDFVSLHGATIMTKPEPNSRISTTLRNCASSSRP